jgi:hypothetical protein
MQCVEMPCAPIEYTVPRASDCCQPCFTVHTNDCQRDGYLLHSSIVYMYARHYSAQTNFATDYNIVACKSSIVWRVTDLIVSPDSYKSFIMSIIPAEGSLLALAAACYSIKSSSSGIVDDSVSAAVAEQNVWNRICSDC